MSTLKLPQVETPYRCDYCGHEYYDSALCCQRRKEYLEEHPSYLAEVRAKQARDVIRNEIIQEMSPLARHCWSWDNWPGTYPFAEAALVALDKIAAKTVAPAPAPAPATASAIVAKVAADLREAADNIPDSLIGDLLVGFANRLVTPDTTNSGDNNR